MRTTRHQRPVRTVTCPLIVSTTKDRKEVRPVTAGTVGSIQTTDDLRCGSGTVVVQVGGQARVSSWNLNNRPQGERRAQRLVHSVALLGIAVIALAQTSR
ncbi:hypothetical protein BJX64DRAFT_253145 [Aspergillus heterothallicus]